MLHLNKIKNPLIISKCSKIWNGHSATIGLSLLITGVLLQLVNVCFDIPSNLLIYSSVILIIIGIARMVNGVKNNLYSNNRQQHKTAKTDSKRKEVS